MHFAAFLQLQCDLHWGWMVLSSWPLGLPSWPLVLPSWPQGWQKPSAEQIMAGLKSWPDISPPSSLLSYLLDHLYQLVCVHLDHLPALLLQGGGQAEAEPLQGSLLQTSPP